MARSRIVRRGSPSLKTWSGQSSPAFGQDLSGTAGLFSPGLKAFGTPNDEDLTILRTRGTWQVRSDDSDLTTETYQVALGVGLCTEEAALAGAIPLPFSNSDWDGWFIYQVMDLVAGRNGSAGSSALEGSQVIDSKAMRKIPSGQVLFLSTQIFSGFGAGARTFEEIIQLRGLLKTS